MAEITTSSVGELLKRLYASWEIEQLVNLTYPVLGDCAREGSASLGGSGFFFPVRSQSAEGHGYIAEDDTLPTPQQSTVLQATVSPTVHAGVVQLTGLSMAVSSQNAMAFARAFDENVRQTIEAMTAYKEGVLFRDGAGILATFDGNPAASVGPHTVSDVGFLRPGMAVDIYDAADDTLHSSEIVISVVDWVNRTVTFATAVPAAVDDTDQIYMGGTQEGTGNAQVDKEPIGFEGSLLATGTYLGIARASVGKWQANNLTASSFFDEDILLRARTRVTQESGIPLATIANKFKCVTHPQQVDVLFKLAVPRIRYTGNDNFDLGNDENVSFGRTKFATSYLAPTDTAYLGDFSYSQSLYTPNGKLHIDTEYNGAALKWVATRDVGLVFVKEYCAFVVRRPNAFVRITSLSTPSR